MYRIQGSASHRSRLMRFVPWHTATLLPAFLPAGDEWDSEIYRFSNSTKSLHFSHKYWISCCSTQPTALLDCGVALFFICASYPATESVRSYP